MLYSPAGFNDDTRAFVSIPAHHDLWRRVTCQWLAELVLRGLVDEENTLEMAFRLAKKSTGWNKLISCTIRESQNSNLGREGESHTTLRASIIQLSYEIRPQEEPEASSLHLPGVKGNIGG